MDYPNDGRRASPSWKQFEQMLQLVGDTIQLTWAKRN